MHKDFIQALGNLVAVIGVVVCAVSGLTRLMGSHYLFSFGAMTVFTGGIALMVLATLIKLYVIERHFAGKR